LSATIKDVAQLAGVSTTTVSHVLNKTRFVAEATREKVTEAAKQLNYAPSAAARSLKVKTTKSLGMIVTTTLNPFYAEVVSEVEKACYLAGYNLILCNTDSDADKTESYIEMLAQKRVDGMLVTCTEYNHDLFLAIIRQRDVPMVVMDWGPTDAFLDRIQDNSTAGGYRATEYLIKQGHKDIAHISGPLDKLSTQQRQEGFTQAMADAGLTVNPEWVIESDYECDGGKAALRMLMAMDETPTAVFIGNDMMAMGALSAAQQLGVKIPEQLSVIGYDNIIFSEHFCPPLTTVNQPKAEMAKLAVKTLLDRLETPRDVGNTEMLEPDLVIRESVAPFIVDKTK